MSYFRFCVSLGLLLAVSIEHSALASFRTNAPAVFVVPDNKPGSAPSFDHFVPESLSNLTWTNFIAHTNGRTMALFANRTHLTGWPNRPPLILWNTNSLIYGMRGFTGISPCWEAEGYEGQVAVTLLTRRHGYARGHSMGEDGFNKKFAGKRVWFVAADNTVVERRVVRDVVRVSQGRDYTLLLFDRDLPPSIQPLRVTELTNAISKCPWRDGAPWLIFRTEQTGHVSAGNSVPYFWCNTGKGGDSGAPDMLPLPGELVFFRGRTSTGPDAAMQAEMDKLCRSEGLDPAKYQMQWVDLSSYPSYFSGF